MPIDASDVEQLVEAELSRTTDRAVRARIRELRVPAHSVQREWDWAKPPGQMFACWTVLEHTESNTAIAYCAHAYGPKTPWGLVFIAGPYAPIMGMDAGWFSTLEEALRDSMAWEETTPDPST